MICRHAMVIYAAKNQEMSNLPGVKQLTMSRLLSILFLLITGTVQAQDLTGIWRGHFLSTGSRILELLGEEDRYKFEVQLNQQNKKFDGVTYSYKTTVFYGKASAIGTINPQTKKVLLEEMKIVEVRMSSGTDACIMTCFLQYTKSGDEEFLEGTYTSMNIRDSSSCGKGTIFLRKVETSDFYKEPFLVKREKDAERLKSRTPDKTTASKPPVQKTATPPVVVKKQPSNTSTNPTRKPPDKPVTKTNPKTDQTDRAVASRIDSVKKTDRVPAPAISIPKVLRSRANEVVKTITTDEKDIVISLYDNGTIDNDTVSVYLDKKLVVDNKRLTDKPIEVRFTLDDNNNFHELVMVAENLGEIPPNTSLMVVKAGGRQYEVRITSTEQKNAVVVFKYEKEK